MCPPPRRLPPCTTPQPGTAWGAGGPRGTGGAQWGGDTCVPLSPDVKTELFAPSLQQHLPNPKAEQLQATGTPPSSNSATQEGR